MEERSRNSNGRWNRNILKLDMRQFFNLKIKKILQTYCLILLKEFQEKTLEQGNIYAK